MQLMLGRVGSSPTSNVLVS